MARIHAFLRLDPARAPEQVDFLRSRVTVLREAGGQFWVAMEDAQVDTLVSQGLSVSVFPDADVLELGPLSYRPASETPQPPEALRATAPSGDTRAFWVVHFVAPPDKAWLQQVARAGAEQVHVLGSSAGAFRASSAVADSIKSLPFVDSVALFQPAFAVSPDLAGITEPLTASTLAQLAIHLPPSDPQGNLELQVFDALDPDDVRAALEAAGAKIVGGAPHGFRLQASAETINAILGVPGVFAASTPVSVEPAVHNAGVIVGANEVSNFGTNGFLVNLDGAGEIGAAIDTGFDVGLLEGLEPINENSPAFAFHPDLVTNIRLLRNSATPDVAGSVVSDGQQTHGTLVAGIMVGDGTASGGRIRGIAPRAALIGLGPLPQGSVPVTAFSFAAAHGARVVNNSWGAPKGRNRYSTSTSLFVDWWCFDNPDVLLVFAAGNNESDDDNDGKPDARSVNLEALAKNVLTVGASENLRNDGGWRDSYRALPPDKDHPRNFSNPAFDRIAGGAAGAFTISDNADEIYLFGSRGKVHTAGGVNTDRVKPDLVAPGTNIVSVRSRLLDPPLVVPDEKDDPKKFDEFYRNNADSMLALPIDRPNYQVKTGTSFAAPIVSGAALLVRQYYRTLFAQMRRPLLLEDTVRSPSVPVFPMYQDFPCVAPHVNGLVFAWITPYLPNDKKNIVGMRVARHQRAPVDAARVDAAPVHLQDDVGDHPAPKIATVGNNTYLLHRHRDGKMRLSCYDGTLRPVASFGTAGVVTLAPDARPDDAVPPELIAVDGELVCAFPAASNDKGCSVRRFRADTGAAVDPASIGFPSYEGTGPHHVLIWNGSRLAICCVAHPGNFQLQVHQVDSAGKLIGAAPVTVLNQAAEIREPCLAWDARTKRYALVWCDARNAPGGEIWLQFLDANAKPLDVAHQVKSVPETRHMRRPCILCHPQAGYLLLWEDDSQDGAFDVYFALLDANGEPDMRARLLRISDTPVSTEGFFAFSDAEGIVVAYNSPREINADRVGVYALNLTPLGAFEAQEDPATPLLKSGRYVTAQLVGDKDSVCAPLAAVSAGGAYYLLRQIPKGESAQSVQCMRLGADGAVDERYGEKGLREVPSSSTVLTCEMFWTGNDRLILAISDSSPGITLYLHDAAGVPVPTFGNTGAAPVLDTAPIDARIAPQIGFVAAPAFNIVIGYGTTQGGALQLRQQRIDAAGVRVGSPANLGAASGVARHDWFQFVNSEERSIAIYHRVDGGVTRIYCRRFQLDGTPDGAESAHSALIGEAINAVLARRPTTTNLNNREYAAVWQYRADATSPWQIRFGRLDREARPMPAPPGRAPSIPVSDVVVIAVGAAGWPLRSAVEPQLVCTYTHEPWADPPDPLPPDTRLPGWSPSYGLAFISESVDGTRLLHFTLLDENGRIAKSQVRPLPPPLSPPPANRLGVRESAGILQVSDSGVKVREFRLVWNGRVFLLYWNEEANGRLVDKYTMLNRYGSRLAYDLPSAALLRATLVNGATNLTPATLPDVAAGYGWGRINLRQTLSPRPPVTLHVRDDCALGPGRSATYRFVLPAGTKLLCVTLNWTDPPGPRLINHLHLTVRSPASKEYRGNLWAAAAVERHSSRAVANPPVAADAHEDAQPFKRVVLDDPPPGTYVVEVSAATFPANPNNQQNLQPFALVFAGTGPEARFSTPVAAAAGSGVY